MVAPQMPVAARPFVAVLSESSLRSKVLLGLAAVCGYSLFSWVGQVFGVPAHADYTPSLLLGSGTAVNLVIVLTCFVLCSLMGTIIAGRVRFDGGLFCGAAGLLALSIRGRTVGDALRTVNLNAESPVLFRTFAIELGVLYGILLAGWGVQWVLHRMGWLNQDAVNDDLDDVDESFSSKLTAAAAQLIFCALAMMLLTPTDAKAQVILGIGCASFLAALASHSLFPVRPSIWFWTAPTVVGIASYLWAPSVSPEWRTGIVGIAGKVFGPYPARALPLDFAGAGTVGTLIGYWLSRKFHQGNMLTDDLAEETENDK